MDPAADGYIDALYDVYAMQEYLSQYCGELTARVAPGRQRTYNAESSRVVQLPLVLTGVLLAATILLLFVLYSAWGTCSAAWGSWPRPPATLSRTTFRTRTLPGRATTRWASCPRVQQDEARHPGNRAMEERLHREELGRIDLEKRLPPPSSGR